MPVFESMCHALCGWWGNALSASYVTINSQFDRLSQSPKSLPVTISNP
jgi:hypothetical protein